MQQLYVFMAISIPTHCPVIAVYFLKVKSKLFFITQKHTQATVPGICNLIPGTT